MGLTILLSTIVCSLIFSMKIFLRTNPTINKAEKINLHPSNISYPDNIFFMFSIEINDLPLIDERIYRPIGIIKKKKDGVSDFDQFEFPIKRCSEVFNISYKYYNIINEKDLNNFYCFSLDNANENITNDKLYINELWGNDGFQMLQIKVYDCINSARFPQTECASSKEIDEKLKYKVLSFYTLQNFIDTGNYEEPFKPQLHENFYYVSNKKSISATLYMKHINLISDTGLVFEMKEKKEAVIMDSSIYFTEDYPEGGKLFTMSIQITNKIEEYSRVYYKLQNFGADVGAIYGALSTACNIIFHFYDLEYIFLRVINNFFLIKENYRPIKIKGINPSPFKTRNSKTEASTNFSSYKKSTPSSKDILTNKDKENTETKTKLNFSNSLKKVLSKKYNMKLTRRRSSILYHQKIFDVDSISAFSENEKKKDFILKFGFVDKFLCLFFVGNCKDKLKRETSYYLYTIGKEYIIQKMELMNYVKYSNFLSTYFLLEDSETKKNNDSFYTPVLASNYVGPKYISDNFTNPIENLPFLKGILKLK